MIKMVSKRIARSRILESFKGNDNERKPQPVKIAKQHGGVYYTNPYGKTKWIDTAELANARQAVKRGARLLDKHVPDWVETIQLDMLTIAHCDVCVCGQLAQAADKRTLSPEQKEYYENIGTDWDLIWNEIAREEGFTGLHAEAIAHGFLSVGCLSGYSFEALEVEWHRLITRRQRAAARAAA